MGAARLLARYWHLAIPTAVMVAAVTVTVLAVPEPRPWWVGILAALAMMAWGCAVGHHIRLTEAEIRAEALRRVEEIEAWAAQRRREAALRFVEELRRNAPHN